MGTGTFCKIERLAKFHWIWILVPNQHAIPSKFAVVDDYGNLTIVGFHTMAFSLG